MKIVYSDKEKLHHPQYEWSRGKLEPYPETAIRAELIKNELARNGFANQIIQSKEFPLEFIKSVADSEMVDFIKSCENLNEGDSVLPHVFPYRDFTPLFNKHPKINLKKSGYYCFDVGIELDKDTYKAAKASVDTALTGAELIKTGEERFVFSLSRPPGHHAGFKFFGGYCIFNNAAVAANYIAKDLGPVAILDVDFHHGNGTQDIFYESSNVLYVSIHGDPSEFFPYYSGFDDEVGEKLGVGANLNIPLPAGAKNGDYEKALRIAMQKITNFDVNALVLSLGFDTFKKDPIGAFNLTTEFYEKMALILGELNVPILAVLEGGYDVEDLEKNGLSFVKGFSKLN